jgi:DNA-binding XRE family transcriptional regulator
MSKKRGKPSRPSEKRAAIEAIRDRSRRERPGPDELIDHGELDELVPQAQHIEVSTLGVRFRRIREGMGLSLTDLSERSGLTRAAISQLENGRNLNPTLVTLFRYAEALGVGLGLVLDDPTRSGKDD